MTIPLKMKWGYFLVSRLMRLWTSILSWRFRSKGGAPLQDPYRSLLDHLRSCSALRTGSSGSKPARSLWLKGASTGEIQSFRPLLRALDDSHNNLPIVIFYQSPDGALEIERMLHGERVLPPWVVLPVPLIHVDQDDLNAISRSYPPAALVVAEGDGYQRLCKFFSNGVEALLIDARCKTSTWIDWPLKLILCDRWRKYSQISRTFKNICVTTDSDRKIAASFGLTDKVEVTGSSKADEAIEEAARIGANPRFDVSHPLVTYGSVRNGEFAVITAAIARIRSEFPNVIQCIAPRYVRRPAQMKKLRDHLKKAGIVFTEGQPNITTRQGEVILLNTMGRLREVYGASTVAVIGGSFGSETKGHSFLEPSAFNIPVICGKGMRNWDGMFSLFKTNNAIGISSDANLFAEISSVLNDDSKWRDRQQNALRTLQSLSGAGKRHAAIVRRMLSSA